MLGDRQGRSSVVPTSSRLRATYLLAFHYTPYPPHVFVFVCVSFYLFLFCDVQNANGDEPERRRNRLAMPTDRYPKIKSERQTDHHRQVTMRCVTPSRRASCSILLTVAPRRYAMRYRHSTMRTVLYVRTEKSPRDRS